MVIISSEKILIFIAIIVYVYVHVRWETLVRAIHLNILYKNAIEIISMFISTCMNRTCI